MLEENGVAAEGRVEDADPKCPLHREQSDRDADDRRGHDLQNSG